MMTMGIDIGSRSSKCVILEDGKLLTYGTIETGPNILKTAQAVVEAAVHRPAGKWGEYRMPLPDTKVDHLKVEDMACIVSTGYGRAIVPFAHRNITEITCHCRGAQWFVPGVTTILDVGGQDTKGIRVGPNGEVADFVMNDKCAAGTGRFMEIVADALHVPLPEIGPLSLKSTKVLPFSTTCAAFGRGAAVAMLKEGERKEDILAGLHQAIATRVTALVKKVGIADKFAITGGIGRNVGMVSRIEQKLGGLKVTLPEEPMIVGALGAALFALDRAKKHGAEQPKSMKTEAPTPATSS
jgi:(R)-2-hydroxyacyl-CoA dehydratese activating ATPase